MIGLILAASLSLAAADAPSVRTADVLPAGATALQLDGGFAVFRFDVPLAEVLPVLTGDAELVHGLGHGADVALRYTTHLGIVHRFGPVLRVRALRSGGVALGARLHPSVQVAGGLQDGLDVGGELATSAALLVTRWTALGALTAEAGFTVQWLVFERRAGEGTRTSDGPYVPYVDLGVELERPLGASSHLSVRLEVAVSLTPDDPFALLGTYPRLVVGGSFLL